MPETSSDRTIQKYRFINIKTGAIRPKASIRATVVVVVVVVHRKKKSSRLIFKSQGGEARRLKMLGLLTGHPLLYSHPPKREELQVPGSTVVLGRQKRHEKRRGHERSRPQRIRPFQCLGLMALPRLPIGPTTRPRRKRRRHPFHQSLVVVESSN